MKRRIIFITILLLLPHTVFATEKDIIKKIVNESENSTQLIDDQTLHHNIRYIGKNPNNYISFNGEKWRIIGVMKNVSTSAGVVEEKLKIVREEPIGSYSWDITNSSVNSGQGVNEWTHSYLMDLLNTNGYWNRSSTICGNGLNGATISCDFTNNGLKEESKSLIESVVWRLGSNWDQDYRSAKGIDFYNFLLSEHGGNYCTNGVFCTDDVIRTTSWTGNVGLINGADYVFATDGGSEAGRKACLNDVVIKDWDDNNPECYSNDWLTTTGEMWTMAPYTDNTYNTTLFYTRNKLGMRAAYFTYGIRPSLYLISNLMIVNGDGSSEHPYEVLPYKEDYYSAVVGDKIDVEELFTSMFDFDSFDLSKVVFNDTAIQEKNIVFTNTGSNEIAYYLEDEVYIINLSISEKIKNPNTGTGISLIIITIILFVTIANIMIKKKKNYILK